MAKLLAVLLLAATLPSSGRADEGAVALEIEPRAREVAPGEPVRVLVHSPSALRQLEGRFLDMDVSFSPLPGEGASDVWAGWGMVPLDAKPGMTTVEVQGVTRTGRSALGTRALTVAEKPFPEERLSVESRFVEPPPEVAERLAGERSRLARIYESREPAALDSRPFVRPVPGGPTSTFGTRRIYNGKPRSPHPGLDLRAATGTEVRSSGPGRVVLAGDLYYSGNTVIVDHGDGLFTLYAHLSSVGVREGREVVAGEVLGLSGATGRVTGPHLHWGAKIGSRPFDPTALLDPALW